VLPLDGSIPAEDREAVLAREAGVPVVLAGTVVDRSPAIASNAVKSGYGGGTVPTPRNEDVCPGRPGHAEVVQVTFDPAEVSFRELLEVFFTIHDPTTLNQQGADRGTQYRSAIFTHSPEQEQTAREVIRDLEAEAVWDDPIVTQVEPLTHFYPAEDYHDAYYRRNPRQPYCQVVIEPKVAKFRQKYLSKLRQPA
jgi:peptide-methionine (S)-S-oxide reductase